jgi:hypothetical protein
VQVDIRNLKPDMIVAEALYDRHGRILIPAGKVLGLELIETMTKWHIRRVNIEPGSLPENFQPITHKLGRRGNQSADTIKEAFKHCDTRHPFIEMLLTETVKRLV